MTYNVFSGTLNPTQSITKPFSQSMGLVCIHQLTGEERHTFPWFYNANIWKWLLLTSINCRKAS